MKPVELNESNFNDFIANGKSVVDFWATWCGPCRMMAPVLDEVAEEAEGLSVGKVNVDEQSKLAERFGVMSIPTFIIFKDGAEVKRLVGAMPKAALADAVNNA